MYFLKGTIDMDLAVRYKTYIVPGPRTMTPISARASPRSFRVEICSLLKSNLSHSHALSKHLNHAYSSEQRYHLRGLCQPTLKLDVAVTANRVHPPGLPVDPLGLW